MGSNPYESPRADVGGLTPDPTAPLPEGFKDRSLGLVLFGVLEILIGGVAASMVPFMALSLAMSQAAAAAGGIRTMIPAMAIYALAAVVFVWLGIGSILKRRWARALILVLSWIWLAGGVLALLWYVPLMSGFSSQMGRQGQIPPGMMVTMLIIMGGTAGCLYVVLPGALVLFYQSKHVKATCESRDPHLRWTDKRPLPVLALSMLLACTAFSMLSSPAYYCVIPVFGSLVRGLPGAVVLLVNAVLLGYLTVGTYRLKMRAWWAAAAFYVFWGLSTVITFSRVSVMELYRAMDFPEEQLKMMQQMAGSMNLFMTWGIAVFMAAFIGYLLYVRRYFVAASPGQAAQT